MISLPPAVPGVSGAGRQAKLGSLLTEAGETAAYGVADYQTSTRNGAGFGLYVAEHPVTLAFVPHLVPMSRGIHATLFAKLTSHDVDLQSLFEAQFDAEPAVSAPSRCSPAARNVRGANTCRLSVVQPQGRDTVVVMSIDNLVKGAAGQAAGHESHARSAETSRFGGIALAP
ncbi:MAG: hypothetical protein CM15mP103_12000 [Gammaproteobacteria bacterium]|nr:MAG: hypothetical protein CM15mP103_12000 [Gammaproteobacteria bacterium]